MQRPGDRRPAGHVSRPDHRIGPRAERGEQCGDRRRVVGEVDVHRDDRLVALVEGHGEPLPVGAAETLLARSAQELDLAELGGRLFDEGRRAVWAVVVDDQQIGVGDARPHRGEQARHVLGLVVRRQDDDRAHGSAAYRCPPNRPSCPSRSAVRGRL